MKNLQRGADKRYNKKYSGMIEVQNTTRVPVDETLLREVASYILGEEKTGEVQLSIALINPKNAKELNLTYRNKDTVPNVLSFPWRTTESDQELGEVLICPQQVKKDAKEYGIMFERALGWMLIHGILHLLGYTHEEDERQAERMEQKEERYLEAVSAQWKLT